MQLVLSLGLPRGDAVLLALLRKYIPMPESLRAAGINENQFYSNISQFQSALGMTPVDGAAFTAELEMRIITPLREAQAMIDGQPYLTRLYATVSPDEMTRDPLFHFNAELPPVSNVHMAKAVGGVCSGGSLTAMILELEDGSRIALDGAPTTRPYPFEGRPVEAAGTGPAAARIQLVGTRGSPTSYGIQQAFTVDQALDRDHPDLVREMHPGLAGPVLRLRRRGRRRHRPAGAGRTGGAAGAGAPPAPVIRRGGGGTRAGDARRAVAPA